MIFFGSIPGPFQKEAVSLSKMFTWTIQSSLVKASRTLLAVGKTAGRVLADAMNPLILPSYMLSIMFRSVAVLSVIELGHPGIAEIVLLGGLVAIPGLEEAHHVLGSSSAYQFADWGSLVLGVFFFR